MFILRTTGTSCSKAMNTGASTTPPVQSSTGTGPNFQPFQEGPTAVGKPTSTPGSSQVRFETWFQTWMTPPSQSCWYRFTIRGKTVEWFQLHLSCYDYYGATTGLEVGRLWQCSLCWTCHCCYCRLLCFLLHWMLLWSECPHECDRCVVFLQSFSCDHRFPLYSCSSFIVLSWSFFSSFRCLTCISCSFPSSFSFVLGMFFSRFFCHHWFRT